jgi:hypothetical protein
MTYIDEPKAADILCGKDKTFGKHPGNMLYRGMIEAKAFDYAAATYKLDKMKLTTEIVATMVSDFGSRFLRPVGPHTSTSTIDGSVSNITGWEEISLTAARDKTSHALRFCAAHNVMSRTEPDANDKMNSSSDVPTAVTTSEKQFLPSESHPATNDLMEQFQQNDLQKGIEEIIQRKLIEKQQQGKEQPLSLRPMGGENTKISTTVRKFKKLPTVRSSVSIKRPKLPKVSSPVKISRAKLAGLSAPKQNEVPRIAAAGAIHTMDSFSQQQVTTQKHSFSLPPQPRSHPDSYTQFRQPALPPNQIHLHGVVLRSPTMFRRTVSTDMIVLATAAAAVEAAEARAVAAAAAAASKADASVTTAAVVTSSDNTVASTGTLTSTAETME